MEAHPPVRFAKDYLSVLDLTHGDLDRLLALSTRLKTDRRLGPRAPMATALAGTHVALLFEKPSLRTKTTFEVAVRELGGYSLDVPSEFAGGSREPIEDVARNLERWVHALVVRTFAQDKVDTFARAARRMHVVNALTDEQHPCQALADALTMVERWGPTVKGRTVAFVGDGNNVAASLAHVACMLGVNVHLASPDRYELPRENVDEAKGVARYGAEVRLFQDAREAVRGVDAVYTDVWASMGEESEAPVRRQKFAPFQVNTNLMALAKPDAVFMHCLPAHRGDEVTSEVIESSASVVFDQAENRLHTQKALLIMLLGT